MKKPNYRMRTMSPLSPEYDPNYDKDEEEDMIEAYYEERADARRNRYE